MVKQIGIRAKADQGDDTFIYLEQKVDGKIHILVPATSAHCDEEDFLQAILDLIPSQVMKHGGVRE